MLCEVTEEIKEISTNEAVLKNFDKKIGTTPEKGRVWRWSNTTSGLRKNTEGPVLRPTVKPVKRFIPELTGNSTGNLLSLNFALACDKCHTCDMTQA